MTSTRSARPAATRFLGHVAGGVGAGAVNLRGVLAGESATAVPGYAPIGVHEDLAAGQPGIALGAAHHEPAAGIDVDVGVVVHQLASDWVNYVLLDILSQLLGESLPVVLVLVLGAYYHGINPVGTALAVFNSNLGLAVRPQVRQYTVLADVGQLLYQDDGTNPQSGA